MPTRLTTAAVLVMLLTACASTAPTATASRCTGACQSHDDGYNWAQSGSLSDVRQCDGYPDEFTRGCRNAIKDYQQLRPAAQGW